MTQAPGREAVEAWVLSSRIPVAPEAWSRIDAFLALLAAESPKANLTADPPEAWWARHAADGLAASGVLRRLAPGAPRLLDLGAGAGFVGFALKAAWPAADVTLMEPSEKKYRFLNLAAARMGLQGLHVLKRAAAPGTDRGEYDAVLARALAPLPEALALALPLARAGGLAAVFQTEAPSPAAPELARALSRRRAAPVENAAYRLPGEARDRHIAVFRKEPE